MTAVNPDRGEVLLNSGELGELVVRFTADRMRRLQTAIGVKSILDVLDSLRGVNADVIIKAVAIGCVSRELTEEEVGNSNLPLMPAAVALSTAFSWALFGTPEPPKIEGAGERPPLENSPSAMS